METTHKISTGVKGRDRKPDARVMRECATCPTIKWAQRFPTRLYDSELLGREPPHSFRECTGYEGCAFGEVARHRFRLRAS
jgi:hypothetical protein